MNLGFVLVENLLFLMCFFFNDTATTEIYTLSLHDALPISTTRPRGNPPTPSAMSRPNDPVETTWMPCRAWESIFMMEPLPNCFSIWARAACSALALPSSMTFPSLTIGLSLILNVAADAGAAPTRAAQPKQRNCLLVAPSRQPSRVLRRSNARSKQTVDLDFYTVLEKLQAPYNNQGLAAAARARPRRGAPESAAARRAS